MVVRSLPGIEVGVAHQENVAVSRAHERCKSAHIPQNAFEVDANRDRFVEQRLNFRAEADGARLGEDHEFNAGVSRKA